jgi:hypothetical protein
MSAATAPSSATLGLRQSQDLKRTYQVWLWHLADISERSADVCFSNRPFGVKHFQTVHVAVC